MVGFLKIIKQCEAILYWNFYAKKRPSRPKARHQSREQLNIIMNGPSSKEYLLYLMGEPDVNKNIEYMVMNDFANAWTDLFWKLKPSFYIAIDPYYGTCKDWIDIIEAVDWKMTLIANPRSMSKFKNRNIRLYYVAPIEIIRKNFVIEAMHMRNYCNMSLSNVSITAILEGVRRGFTHIELYGLDLSNYMELSVDINNHLIDVIEHSYGEREIIDLHDRYPKIIDKWQSQINNFKSYYIIEEYAQKRGIKILNMNPNSLVDAFKKRKNEE